MISQVVNVQRSARDVVRTKLSILAYKNSLVKGFYALPETKLNAFYEGRLHGSSERVKVLVLFMKKGPWEGPFFRGSWLKLLQFNRCAGGFQFLLSLFGIFLRYILFNILGRTVYKILRFLQAELCDLSDCLNDVNLLVTSCC